MLRRLLPALIVVSPLASAAPAFIGLDAPGSQLSALSRDGSVAVGSITGAASGGFRWQAGHVTLLREAVSARAISASGRYLAGSSLDLAQREVATWWDADGNPHRMPSLPGASGGVLGMATGITDEPRVVGMTLTADNRSAAFSWQPPHPANLLPVEAGASARASGIDADGACVYGWIEHAGAPRRAAIWDGATSAHPPTIGAPGEALGASRDCEVLVGFQRDDNGSSGGWRWSAGRGVAALIGDDTHGAQINASDDAGTVLAGSLGNGNRRVAAIWSAATGLLPLDSFLQQRAVALPTDWTLVAATAVSGDGRRIGGWGQHAGHFDSFIVELPAMGGSTPDVPQGEPER